MTRARRASTALASGALLLVLSTAVSAQGLPGGYGVGSGAGGIVAPGGTQGSTVLPGVRTSLTVSDNLLLRPRGEEAAGFRAEVSPYVRATVHNSRVQGAVAYDLRAFHSSADSVTSSGLRHDLNASGNAILVDDNLGVQASARTYHTSTSAFGLVGADQATTNTNTTRVSSVTVSPYLFGRIGTFASYRAKYSLTRSDVSGSAGSVIGRTNELVSALISSGPQFGRWGWSLASTGARYEYASGLDLHSASTVAALYYVFGPELRLGLTANYLYSERLTNSKGKNRGWGPGFTADWVPSTRTTLRLALAEQYYGASANVSLAHRAGHWTMGVNYGRSVFSSNNAGILTMNLGSLLSADGFAATLNPIFQQLVNHGVLDPNDTLIGAGILSDALVRQRMISASIGYLLPRGSLALTGYKSVRETLLDSTLFLPASDPLVTSSFGHFETRGATLSLSMPIDSRTTAFLSGSLRDISSLTRPDRARISLINLAVRTSLDSKTSVAAGLRRAVQSAVQGGAVGYDENAVFGTLDVRF